MYYRNNNVKHIYWFAYFNLSEPSVRYRAKYVLDNLIKSHGISSTFIYPAYDLKNIFRFISAFFSVLFFRKQNSVIVFQKLYTSGIYATALKVILYFQPRNTIYDIDDAEHTRRPVKTIQHFLKNCSMCTVGSEALERYAMQFNKKVFLLTSPVIRHGILKTERNELFTIGWIGYYTAHEESLMQLAFPAIAAIDFPVKLIILGVTDKITQSSIIQYFSHNANVTVEAPLKLNWQNELSIYEQIRKFDVAIAPLIENDFNESKSAFKLKQCLSCGVPVLASSTGENKRFIINGVNGYLCESPGEYAKEISSIRKMNSKTYYSMSKASVSSFDNFSIEYYCNTLLAIANKHFFTLRSNDVVIDVAQLYK
jgi:glycosyltransferase involved in cell wall biosynthesis